MSMAVRFAELIRHCMHTHGGPRETTCVSPSLSLKPTSPPLPSSLPTYYKPPPRASRFNEMLLQMHMYVLWDLAHLNKSIRFPSYYYIISTKKKDPDDLKSFDYRSSDFICTDPPLTNLSPVESQPSPEARGEV